MNAQTTREPKQTGIGNRAIAILAAVLLHLLIGAFLFFTDQFDKPDDAAKDTPEIDTIVASTVSADELRNQKQRILEASAERERLENERRETAEKELKKLELRKKVEERRLEQLQKNELKKIEDHKKAELKKLEKQKQAELKKIEDKKKVEQEKLKKIKQQQIEEQALALKKRVERERIEKELEQEKQQEVRDAELKKRQKLIQKELEQERKEAAIQAQRDAERKRKADALAKQLEADSQAEIDAENARKAAELKAAHQQMLNELASEEKFATEEKNRRQEEAERNSTNLYSKYVAIIASKVFANFQPPPGIPLNMSALVKIKLDRNGNLLEGRIVRSSGNLAFDRSCEAAIQKAAPFPMPQNDEAANKKLRDIEFEMKYSGPGR